MRPYSAASALLLLPTLGFVVILLPPCPPVLAGFTEVEQFGAGGTISMAWGDYDGDGFLDMAVGNYSGQNYLYTSLGNGSFDERAEFGSASTFPVVWGDFDNDGDLDLAVGNAGVSNNQNVLYLNNGDGSFSEGPQLGKKRTNALAWADFDLDGDLDLAVGNGLLGSPQDNRLLINNGDSTFTSVPRFGLGQSASLAWGDFDNDGDPDLAVGNGGFGYVEQNYLYINEGDTVFTERAEFGTGDTSCLVWGDFDNDGDLDMAVANWDGGQNFLYMNNGDGSFAPVPRFGLRDPNTLAWGDCDNDGDLDLAVGNGDFTSADTNFLYINTGDSTFTETPEFGLGSTDGVAWGDYDNDGDLDLAAGNEHSPATNYIYVNDEDGGDYLILHLVGHYHDMGVPYSNRDGIGARVIAYEAGHLGDPGRILAFREVFAHGGFASQNALDVHLGVGDAGAVDLRIVWPGSGGSRITQDAAGVATGRRLVIHETDMASVGGLGTPPGLMLSHARPNPFAGRTEVNLSLTRPLEVRVTVYDVAGRLVANVMDGGLPAGSHDIVWDGRDSSGMPVKPGVYFCRVSAGDAADVRKVVALR